MRNDGVSGRSWTVVMRPDGVVDDVQGGAPIQWLGRPLTERAGIPEGLGDSARKLVSSNRGSHWLNHARVTIDVDGRSVAVDLVVCDAVPLRRSTVVVRDMVMR